MRAIWKSQENYLTVVQISKWKQKYNFPIDSFHSVATAVLPVHKAVPIIQGQWSALMWAVHKGWTDIVRLLLERGSISE